MFQYLTETLDKRVLAVLANRDIEGLANPVSLNLNVGTILSRDFQKFHKAVGKNASKVVVEMQTIHIFSDMNTYGYARDTLQEMGYRVLVDGLSLLGLQFFEPGLLQSDFVKINWDQEFEGEANAGRLAQMREVVAATGKDSVILSRVDTEEAVKWGLRVGVSRFQGFFIDDLMSKLAEVQMQKAQSKSKPIPQPAPAVATQLQTPPQPKPQPAPAVATQPQAPPQPVAPAVATKPQAPPQPAAPAPAPPAQPAQPPQPAGPGPGAARPAGSGPGAARSTGSTATARRPGAARPTDAKAGTQGLGQEPERQSHGDVTR